MSLSLADRVARFYEGRLITAVTLHSDNKCLFWFGGETLLSYNNQRVCSITFCG